MTKRKRKLRPEGFSTGEYRCGECCTEFYEFSKFNSHRLPCFVCAKNFCKENNRNMVCGDCTSYLFDNGSEYDIICVKVFISAGKRIKKLRNETLTPQEGYEQIRERVEENKRLKKRVVEAML